MGLAIEGDKLALACKDQLIIFKGAPTLAETYPKKPGIYDTLFVPISFNLTGQVDLHDINWIDGSLLAVNTSFSCLARPDSEFHFVPIWQPKFISSLVSEDRCHLNGMAIENDQIKYVTALGSGDSRRSWRDHIPGGGVLWDIKAQRPVVKDLQMPHSPRILDGKLYLLQSALGQLCTVDIQSGKLHVIYQQNGFARGLAKYDDYLFVGYSKLRKNSSIFGKLQFSNKAVHCGISVIHGPTGSFVGEIRYHSSVDEIYDIQILANYIRPNILNTSNEEYKSALITPDSTFWGHQE